MSSSVAHCDTQDGETPCGCRSRSVLSAGHEYVDASPCALQVTSHDEPAASDEHADTSAPSMVGSGAQGTIGLQVGGIPCSASPVAAFAGQRYEVADPETKPSPQSGVTVQVLPATTWLQSLVSA